MSDPVFELKNVSYSYLGKFPALKGVSFCVGKGERIALLGANGTGKSTLLSLLDGLIFPDIGAISAFGRDLTEKAFEDEVFARQFRSRIGFVFQDSDVQLFCPTAKEDIMFGPLQFGVDKDILRKRFEKVISLFSIQDLMERAPHQLSVGERRKVALASTLIMEPEVLIMDEPTAGLDPKTSMLIADILQRFHSEGKTVIAATHDMHMVAEIADFVYVLGREKDFAAKGPAQEILGNTELLKENNLIHAHTHRHAEGEHVHPHQHFEHHG